MADHDLTDVARRRRRTGRPRRRGTAAGAGASRRARRRRRTARAASTGDTPPPGSAPAETAGTPSIRRSAPRPRAPTATCGHGSTRLAASVPRSQHDVWAVAPDGEAGSPRTPRPQRRPRSDAQPRCGLAPSCSPPAPTTGALPFPGWDLPGVLTAGGAAGAAQGPRRRAPDDASWSRAPARSCCPSRPGWPRHGADGGRRRTRPATRAAGPPHAPAVAQQPRQGGEGADVCRVRWPATGSRCRTRSMVVAAHGARTASRR